MVVLSFGVALLYVNRANHLARNNAYVLHAGQRLSLEPLRDRQRNLEILCEGHIRNFHELFFSLEPDLQLIKRNIEEKALFMTDNSGKRLYSRLVEKRYFHDVVMRDYRYIVESDSIEVDYASYPFHFTFYGKQAIEKGRFTTYRNLTTSGYLKEVGTTPNNLNGIKILDFKVLDNSDIRDQ
ncbi:hypothetical protein [Croceitalea marina]|uniref:hypothetical protein n=1 Tax=Croceitalea marina TaxID=1775166 RepID=UPI00367188D8